MAINIKNEQTVDAVRRLAARYGTSYTKAIEMAAEAALVAPSESTEQAAFDQVQQIAAAYRAHISPAAKLDADTLYDKDGLFR